MGENNKLDGKHKEQEQTSVGMVGHLSKNCLIQFFEIGKIFSNSNCIIRIMTN